MGLNQQYTDIAAKIAADLQSGGMSRASLGGGGTAFGWSTNGSLPRTLADFVSTATADGMTFPVTVCAPSAQPVGPVGPGAAKPNAVDIATRSESLVKHAGYGSATLEDSLSAAGLAPAILSVLAAGCLMSFEADAMGALGTGAGQSTSGATWTEALTAAQAKVIGAGGSPGLTVVSSADYGALLQEIANGAGFAQAAESAIGSFFGSLLHASPQLASGTAYVLDPTAVIAVEHKDSPLIIVDSVSQAANNITRIVADLVAATIVTNAALVVEATKV